MHSFELNLADGWNRLSDLLEAEPDWDPGDHRNTDYSWNSLTIVNTHATAAMKVKAGATSEPAEAKGLSIPAASGSMTWDSSEGRIDGQNVWIWSDGGGTCDVTFI